MTTTRDPRDSLPEPDGASVPGDMPTMASMGSLPKPMSPPLPHTIPQEPPRFLVIDDNQDFLEALRAIHESTDLIDHATIETWLFELTTEEQLFSHVQQQMTHGPGYAALVVDLNLRASGKSNGGFMLIDRLRAECDRLAYIPAVIMTAFVDPELQQEAFDRRIESFIIKLDGEQRSPQQVVTGLLSHRLITDLPQWQAQAEERFWLDLNEEVAAGIAERQSIKAICQQVGDKLLSHFQASAIYVRERTTDGELRLLGGRDGFSLGDIALSERALPFIHAALQSPADRTVFRFEALDHSHLGRWSRGKIAGSRAMVALMAFAGVRLGYIAIYRPTSARPFRRLDEGLAGLLAQQLAAAVYRSRQLASLESQQQLAAALMEFARLDAEEDILLYLARMLHEVVADPHNAGRSRTMVRRLVPGSNEIPRLGKPFGKLEAVKPGNGVTLRHSAEWVVARAMKDAKPLMDGAVTSETRGFSPTAEGVQSYLAVPIMSQGVIIGVIYTESLDGQAFRDINRDFTVSACASAADAVIRLRSQRFALGMAELLDSIVTGQGQQRDDVLRRAVRLLFDYTGYAELLYLTPNEPGHPWLVQQVFGEKGEPTTETRRDDWQRNTKTNWDKTFIKAVVAGAITTKYTEDLSEIFSDTEVRNNDGRTLAEAVVPLREIDETMPRGALALKFVHPFALSRSQVQLLDRFGRTLARLLGHQGEVGALLDRLVIDEQNARLGEAFGFIRHGLRIKLSDIRQSALELEGPAPNPPEIGRHIRERLTEADRDISRGRNLVKIPLLAAVSLEAVWRRVRSVLADLAKRQDAVIALGRFEVAEVRTDFEILEAIISMLVENALLHGGAGITVQASSAQHGAAVAIDVADDGLGLSQFVRPRLFEIGVTTSPSSTGAGLFLCRARARAMGGDLAFIKQETKGARFRLILPAFKEGGIE